MSGIYSDLDNRIFIGKKIRLAFPAADPQSGKPILELIKVKVSHQTGHNNSPTSELIGMILEESNYISDYRAGDIIAFKKSEITEMCSEGSC